MIEGLILRWAREMRAQEIAARKDQEPQKLKGIVYLLIPCYIVSAIYFAYLAWGVETLPHLASNPQFEQAKYMVALALAGAPCVGILSLAYVVWAAWITFKAIFVGVGAMQDKPHWIDAFFFWLILGPPDPNAPPKTYKAKSLAKATSEKNSKTETAQKAAKPKSSKPKSKSKTSKPSKSEGA